MKKLVASVAVFRELYNANSNVQDVIGEFIKNTVVEEGLESFTTHQMGDFLNRRYGFELPPAVIYFTIKNLNHFDCNRGTCTLRDKSWLPVHEDIAGRIIRVGKQNDIMERDLLSFVRSNATKIKMKLEMQDSEVIDDFCDYLLDNKSSVLKDIFSLFIIQNNFKYHEQFALIREGTVLYEGLSYCHTLENEKLWNEDMIIYLDTEVLFHAYGLNGELYKDIFNDFFKLVEEINASFSERSLDKRIEMKYFISSQDEIDAFFGAATRIKEGKETLNPSKQAMVTIVNECDDIAAIIEKQDDFYDFLDDKGINVDSADYHIEELREFNIESLECVQDLKNEFPKFTYSVEKHLNRLSNINKLRRGKHIFSFENTKTILVSGTMVVYEISKRFKKDREVPLSTSLEFMTNKMWLKLNKGFSKDGSNPKSFDLLTKAQLVLSNSIKMKLESSYEKIYAEYQSGSKTIEQFRSNYVALRSSLKKPESICVDNSAEIISLITEEEFSHRYSEMEYVKGRFDEAIDHNDRLSAENTELKNFRDKYEKLDSLINHAIGCWTYIQKNKKKIVFNVLSLIILILCLQYFSSNSIITGAATLVGTLYIIYDFVSKYISSEEKI